MTTLKQIFENNITTLRSDDETHLKMVADWLKEKRQEKQKTYEFLKEKAKTDIIHRSMYLMSGAEIDCLDSLLAELQDCDIEKQKVKV
jgi:hypothetical protein